jgi:hypothetical protein
MNMLSLRNIRLKLVGAKAYTSKILLQLLQKMSSWEKNCFRLEAILLEEYQNTS